MPLKLTIGFSALKCLCCNDANKRNIEVCPFCEVDAVIASNRVPLLTKEGSYLKCRVNGSIMNHENYPVALPSKHIYSISALMSSETEEEYYCELT